MARTGRFLICGAVAAACAAALIYFPYCAELQSARHNASQGSRIINTAAGRIEYGDMGSGFPVLSIHGAGGSYDQGLANLAGIMVGDFRVIAPSRFGYLRTPVPADPSPAAQADAHLALLNALKLRRAVVVGVSAGARSALELAIRHPDSVAALILIVPGTYAPDSPVAVENSRSSRFTLWLVSRGADFIWWSLERLAPSVLVRFIGVRPELLAVSARQEQDRVMSIVRSIEPLSQRFAGINIDSRPDLRPLPLRKVAAPTLIISARDDLFNTLPAAQFAAAGIPQAKLVVYDTGGHLLVGRQESLRDTIASFLSGASLRPKTL